MKTYNRKQKKVIFIKNKTTLHNNVIALLLTRENIFHKKKIDKNSYFITKKNYEKIKNQLPVYNHKRLVIFCDLRNGYKITNKKILDFFIKKKKINICSFFKCINLIGTYDVNLYNFLNIKKKKKKPCIINVFKSRFLLEINDCIK